MENKEIVIKCKSCGASLNLHEKHCSYCGTLNPNYNKKEVKEIKPQKNQKTGMGSLFGGLLGNVFDDVLKNFDEE